MSYLFNELIYKPLYNGLILIMDLGPWVDAGIAIIFLTIVVKLILFPLSKKAIVTQLKMRRVEPELAKVREKHKEDRAELAKQTMNLYREHKINPFSSIFLILIQLPVIFALYKVFLSSDLHAISGDLLYSFVPVPHVVNISFLNLIDVSGKSFILALIAGVTTYIQIRLSMPSKPKNEKPAKERTFKDDLARSMSIQMRYVFPVLAFIISWSISGAIALYWVTSNVFTIGQELVIRKTVKSKY